MNYVIILLKISRKLWNQIGNLIVNCVFFFYVLHSLSSINIIHKFSPITPNWREQKLEFHVFHQALAKAPL